MKWQSFKVHSQRVVKVDEHYATIQEILVPGDGPVMRLIDERGEAEWIFRTYQQHKSLPRPAVDDIDDDFHGPIG